MHSCYLGFEDVFQLDEVTFYLSLHHASFALGYTPGDPDDQYMYIYPDLDETRKVVNKIGEGLGLT
jgi:hypothetical protein